MVRWSGPLTFYIMAKNTVSSGSDSVGDDLILFLNGELPFDRLGALRTQFNEIMAHEEAKHADLEKSKTEIGLPTDAMIKRASRNLAKAAFTNEALENGQVDTVLMDQVLQDSGANLHIVLKLDDAGKASGLEAALTTFEDRTKKIAAQFGFALPQDKGQGFDDVRLKEIDFFKVALSSISPNSDYNSQFALESAIEIALESFVSGFAEHAKKFES